MTTSKQTIQEKPIIALREFFSTNNKPVSMTKFQEFWKSLSEEEKDNLRQAIQSWDGESEFVK